MKKEEVLDKVFLGHICTAMMLNEFEIAVWCYALYIILNEYNLIKDVAGVDNLIKFKSSEELVISCAIFAKVSINNF